MSLQKGNAACTTGLSKRIYDARLAAISFPFGYPAALVTATQDGLKADSFAIASAVVDEIQANGESRVTIKTTDAGLQTSSAAGTATGAPAVDKPLVGTVA